MLNYLCPKNMIHANREVLDTLYGGNLTPEKARMLTEDIVFEEEAYFSLQLLAMLGMRDGFGGFPEAFIPRLKGIYRHYHVRKSFDFLKQQKVFKRLEEDGIEFLCGYYLSLDYRYCRNGLQAVSFFDIVVRQTDFSAAEEIIRDEGMEKTEVMVCDLPYVWDSARIVEKHGCRIKTLSPTSILLLYGNEIKKRMTYKNRFSEEYFLERLFWLYEYKAIDSDAEGIDFSILHSSSRGILRFAIRYILMYAYSYYGDSRKTRQLAEKIPLNLRYVSFLLKTAVRSYLI